MHPAPITSGAFQRFAMLEQLASSALGSVYRARDPQVEHDVAIKLLAGQADTELRSITQLAHRNIVRVYEVGQDGDVAFVVMEYIAGGSLAVWLAQPRSTAEILAKFAQAGRGLAAAHACGIVHRDFKPQNVLVGVDGHARVADFGLSRIASRPAPAFVDHEPQGTPRYAAPELAYGRPPTAASDVFAFCMALSDALAGRDIAPAVRAQIVAGVAQISGVRPTLATVVAALEGKRGRPRRWLFALGAAAVMAGAAVTALTVELSDADVARPTRAALLDRRWDATQRSELRRLLGSGPTAKWIVTALDDQRRGIDDQLATTTDASMRCLERRAIELGAVAKTAISAHPPIADLETVVGELPRVADCASAADLPLADDRAAVAGLFERFATYRVLAPDARVAALDEIEVTATRLGEPELAARTAIARAIEARDLDQLADADAALVRAARGAQRAHSMALAVRVLVEQSIDATRGGDPRAGAELAGRARDVADGLPAPLVAQIHAALAHAAREAGDDAATLAEIASTRDAIAGSGRTLAALEEQLRFDQIATLARHGGSAAALDLARDTVAFARDNGEHRDAYAVALTVFADALVRDGHAAVGLPYREQALDVLVDLHGAECASVVRQRIAVAGDLMLAGHVAAARDNYERVVVQIERMPALAELLPDTLGALAAATLQLGRFDPAIALFHRAVDAGVAQDGAAHPRTLELRRQLADACLDGGKLGDAERQIAALDEAYRDTAQAGDFRLHRLRGVEQAKLLLARHRPHEAEPLITAALAMWPKLHGNVADRIELLRNLGACLRSEHRIAASRIAFAEARTLAASASP